MAEDNQQMYIIVDTTDGVNEQHTVTLDQILDEINRDRSDTWEAYTSTDQWEDALHEWTSWKLIGLQDESGDVNAALGRRLANAVLAGEVPVMAFASTYDMRRELTHMGHLSYQRRGSNPKGIGPFPSHALAGKSYIVNHGDHYTRNTFYFGQVSVVMEDISREEACK